MKVQQLGEKEIHNLKCKALELQRRGKALFNLDKSSEALNAIAEATKILTWVNVQEGRNEEMKRCIELQKPKSKEIKVNKGEGDRSPKRQMRIYRLAGPPPRHDHATYERIFSYGRSQGKRMPSKLKF